MSAFSSSATFSFTFSIARIIFVPDRFFILIMTTFFPDSRANVDRSFSLNCTLAISRSITEPPNDFTIILFNSFGESNSPITLILDFLPLFSIFPPEIVIFSPCTARCTSSKLTAAPAILNRSKAISTSFSPTPNISTFFISDIFSTSSLMILA